MPNSCPPIATHPPTLPPTHPPTCQVFEVVALPEDAGVAVHAVPHQAALRVHNVEQLLRIHPLAGGEDNHLREAGGGEAGMVVVQRGEDG